MVMTSLEILPIGRVYTFWLRYLRYELLDYFSSVTISEPLDMPLELNSRGQVLADRLLDNLWGYPTEADKVLAVLNKDMTVRGVNYIFGLASLGGRVAVISPVRLRESFYNRKCKYSTFLDRLVKEALHELGHTFGLSHCRNKECNMKFSSTVEEIDTKSVYFCDSCLDRMRRLTQQKAALAYAANGNGRKNLMRTLIESLGSKSQKP